MSPIIGSLVPVALVPWPVLQIGVPTVQQTVAFLPRLLGALIVLFIGWVLGRAAFRVVRELADRVELDRAVLKTPLGRILGGTEAAVSRAFGVLAKWFVYALAILAAADLLAIPLLSEWIQTAVSYLPAFVAGLLVIVFGFIIADWIGDAISRTRAAAETAYMTWVAWGVRLFLYFTVVVIGLDTMGVNVDILFVFARALAWGFAAAVAIGAGVALGWGGHTYVQENIGRWLEGASGSMPSPPEAPQADGGSELGED